LTAFHIEEESKPILVTMDELGASREESTHSVD
jgi:hypothetical protein